MFKGTLVNYNVMMNKILNYVKYKKKREKNNWSAWTNTHFEVVYYYEWWTIIYGFKINHSQSFHSGCYQINVVLEKKDAQFKWNNYLEYPFLRIECLFQTIIFEHLYKRGRLLNWCLLFSRILVHIKS